MRTGRASSAAMDTLLDAHPRRAGADAETWHTRTDPAALARRLPRPRRHGRRHGGQHRQRAGFALTVHTRSRGEGRGAGGRPAPPGPRRPAEAARAAAASRSACPTRRMWRLCCSAPDGVAEACAPGTVVIDFSTIAAVPTAGFARRLAARSAARILLDSPVSGGPARRTGRHADLHDRWRRRRPSRRRVPYSRRWAGPSPISAPPARGRSASRPTS